MLLSQIEERDVINVVDGSVIGNIVDLEIEPHTGQIFSIYVERCGAFRVFSKRDKICIAWDQIIKIGEDVIIVNYPPVAD